MYNRPQDDSTSIGRDRVISKVPSNCLKSSYSQIVLHLGNGFPLVSRKDYNYSQLIRTDIKRRTGIEIKKKNLTSISCMLIDLTWYSYRTRLLHFSLRDRYPGKLLVVSHTYYVTNLNHIRQFFPNIYLYRNTLVLFTFMES